MSPIKLTAIGQFEDRVTQVKNNTVSLEGLAPGVHSTDDVFFKLTPNASVDWVVSRECDHRGGKLFLSKDGKSATCPLHGWVLDAESLKYHNVNVLKQSLAFQVEAGRLSFQGLEKSLALPEALVRQGRDRVRVRFLAHACVAIFINDFCLVTDPWLVGPAFTTGWWHAFPPKSDAIEILQNASAIYLSHNHPDHLHEETLRYLPRDIPILFPAFTSDSVVRVLQHLGFNNFHALSFNSLYRLEESQITLSILKSGDFRDDSGLFIAAGEFSALLTVDSNALNNFILPQSVDLLMTSFASGASGFPLCFEVYDLAERRQIAQRNRQTVTNQVRRYLSAVKPKCYVPYAGFFTEAAFRDRLIQENNQKNSPSDIITIVEETVPGTRCFNPLETDELRFSEAGVEASTVNLPRLYTLDRAYTEHYLHQAQEAAQKFAIAQVQEYFDRADFQDNLILYLQPTDDDFNPICEGLMVDFQPSPPHSVIISADQLAQRFQQAVPPTRHLLIKVRRDSLYDVIEHRLPWEHLSIGFQCRIDRKPNVYNSDFWFYFTNIYIGNVYV
jgi:CMP-N-acetylneuraminate monooxygenase